ncbi:MAG TPA: LLM class F420-dependent oxidoreductase [Acidimicrobiia bacterium]|jgi:F420-dependent oxidoreductase-like protein|nr:LLM class F420-dependent oxidoreductase [Acidimicrobiia bacterium]
MKFGAFVPQGWRHDLAGIPSKQHWPTMLGIAKDIEDLGFESLWVYDHFHTVPEPTQEVTYEAWTLMAALAATTDTVRLGQMCTCNTYRPPSYLAKVAASIDVISGGRLEMGIGAGWYEQEHDGYGYPFLSPGGRLGMLREGVEIMKAMWTEDVVHYKGKNYTLKGAICQPKPVQQPHIPFWIAGGGEKVTLNIAARHASYTNFGGDHLDVFDRKSEILRSHCEDVGTDFDSINRSANFNIFCADTGRGVEEKKAWYRGHLREYVSEGAAERSVRNFEPSSGTPEQVVATLKEFEAAGMTYAIVNFADVAYDRSSIELFAKEVIPAFS